jgi:hypothetical protein
LPADLTWLTPKPKHDGDDAKDRCGNKQGNGVSHRAGHNITAGALYRCRGRSEPAWYRVATLITGVHWSGPVFFGLKKRPRAAVATGA